MTNEECERGGGRAECLSWEMEDGSWELGEAADTAAATEEGRAGANAETLTTAGGKRRRMEWQGSIVIRIKEYDYEHEVAQEGS
jgi:hypothetical protein